MKTKRGLYCQEKENAINIRLFQYGISAFHIQQFPFLLFTPTKMANQFYSVHTQPPHTIYRRSTGGYFSSVCCIDGFLLSRSPAINRFIYYQIHLKGVPFVHINIHAAKWNGSESHSSSTLFNSVRYLISTLCYVFPEAKRHFVINPTMTIWQ